MPEFAGRHYMNPAYGRAIAQSDGDDGSDAEAQSAARNGNLKHVTIHIQKEGGFSVNAHYQHPRDGHHTVASKHSSSHEAAEEAGRHLRRHESRGVSRNSYGSASDDSEN